jgi:ferric-dicitrate binding protein FerR (iron transport regulator)
MSPPNMLPAANDDALAEQARGWIAWLASGDISDARMQAFERWLQQPGHRRAFEHERALWRSVGPRPQAGRSRRRPRRLRWAMAAAAALAMLVAWPEAWLRLQADHRSTHVVQDVLLPDGSRAVLDADSAIAVHFDAHARQVELLRGRAWFEVSRMRSGVSACAPAMAWSRTSRPRSPSRAAMTGWKPRSGRAGCAWPARPTVAGPTCRWASARSMASTVA